MNEDQQELLANVPEDGTAIGNVTLKQKLGWPDEKYWAVRDSLIVGEHLLLGRGRGGSVRRAPLVHEAEVPQQAEAEELPEVAVAKAEQKKRESDLYEPAIRVLDTKWSRDLLLEQFFVQRTAAQGRRETGGTWTRPDIVAIYVASYQYLPSKILDVVTFEIKPVETADVTCVYEALAHLKAATQAFVLIAAPDPNQANIARVLEAIAEEAGRHGIGLIVARDITDYDTWEFRVDAVRREPDPANVDEFIETQISEANKQRLRKWVK
jgi:hypothetical protein